MLHRGGLFGNQAPANLVIACNESRSGPVLMSKGLRALEPEGAGPPIPPLKDYRILPQTGQSLNG